MIRNLLFEHRGRPYRAEIDDNDDRESSDTVTIFDPDDAFVSEYDTSGCWHDEEFVAEARREIDAST